MPNKPTIATLFSGGGVCLARLKDSFEIAWGVEYSPELAEVYRANISPNIIVSRVQDVAISKLSKVDVLQASPVCKEFSNAKVGGKEGPEEINQAQAVVDILKAVEPPVFILENVRAYMGSHSYQKIVLMLLKMGYTISQQVLNSANFGVPQTRERLILRAVKDRPMPYLPDATPWQGWYNAIEDLIPTLPDDKFADWQLERLPDDFDNFLMESKFPGKNALTFHKYPDEPVPTVTSLNPNWKAFLIPGDNTSNDTVRMVDEPMVTVRTRSIGQCPARAFLVSQEYGNSNTTPERILLKRDFDEPRFTIQASETKSKYVRAWLSQGRVVRMTPRALARFQSLPDTYQLPDKASLACTAVGNGWPSLMAKTIIEQLVA